MGAALNVRVVGGTVVVRIGAIGRADVPLLCAKAEAWLTAVPDAPLRCEVGAGARADLVVVDALARLRLAARRHGRDYRVDGAPPALRDLLALVGLRDALGADAPAGE
ncbi:STAS domain-containing protein [Yinghuangia seranimata]|uniref:STAS domain-containing protein n=1 Tax=Yinghuangia seranimata TaxID=408067 RepID=UPI00248C0A48|nr:STAS domain-containing protein [Yinghuangia seranimata]MDI2125334.1 STAS domain-containing protein [Yinghuangia seranimata]